MAIYKLVRATQRINHEGVWRVPGTDTQDFVVRSEQATALEAMGAASILVTAVAPIKSGPVLGRYRDGFLQAIDDGQGGDFGGGGGGGGGSGGVFDGGSF